MRSFVVAGICLLMASSVMAAVQVDVTARGIGAIVDPAVDGTSIILDVTLTSTDPMGGLGGYGMGFPGAPDGVMYAPMQTMWGGSQILNYADQPGDGMSAPPASTFGWDCTSAWANTLLGGDLNTIPVVFDGLNYEAGTVFAVLGIPATSGLAFWLEVTLLPVGTPEYTIDALGTVSDMAGANLEVSFNGLTVLPEPASALLLLLGVPFLRRRR